MTDVRLRGVLKNGMPGVGDAAPDFELPVLIAGVRQPLRLSSYREEVWYSLSIPSTGRKRQRPNW